MNSLFVFIKPALERLMVTDSREPSSNRNSDCNYWSSSSSSSSLLVLSTHYMIITELWHVISMYTQQLGIVYTCNPYAGFTSRPTISFKGFITESVNCDKILTRDHHAILLFMFYDFSINKSQVDSCQCWPDFSISSSWKETIEATDRGGHLGDTGGC